MEEEIAGAAPSLRLVNFVSEEQLDNAKKTRGARVEDGTAQRDRPLYEILKENKDKKDAEFNERFKHRPPKALDEDETEFLENLEMSRKEYERQLANEEAEQLRSFQEAVAAQSSIVRELKDTPIVSGPEEKKPVVKTKQPLRPGSLIITVKPQPKKARTETASEKSLEQTNGRHINEKTPNAADKANTFGGLVSYSDESEDED
ncbi:protein FAM192A [Iris pallida]|uniref:Protein FAM192A n=1 Tax=Iris pallida TaxID=29817 RepID=A0AAX6EQG3_IRIPA|nr:protein FAM192A [Iris pallida]KAJ6844553.1 protein FAM192A [Iris pallida]